MSTPNRSGKLVPSVSHQGKRIDVWSFHADAPKLNQIEKITFEVALLGSMDFVISTKNIPKQRWQDLKGDNLKQLKAQALKAAQYEFDLYNNLVWSSWLEIQITELSLSGKYRDVTSGAQACVTYRNISRAETPDGQAYTLNDNDVLVPFPSPIGIDRTMVEGEFRTGRSVNAEQVKAIKDNPNLSDSEKLIAQMNLQDSRDHQSQFAYQPDTPENRAGLDSIIQAINGVNRRLQQFLQPEEITKTLQRAAQNRQLLLASPSEEPPAPKSSSFRSR